MLRKMLQNAFLCILGIMVGCLALLWVVSVLLKGATQKFLVKFGPKKTVAVAIMALIFLPIATAHAGDTIARIEDGNLVKYQRVGIVARNVPKELTDEQAQQLVDGVGSPVEVSSTEYKNILGVPLVAKVTHFTVSLGKEGLGVERETNEFLDPRNVVSLVFLAVAVFLLGVIWIFERSKGTLFSVLFVLSMVCSFNLLVGRFMEATAFAVFTIVAMSTGGLLGLFLRRKEEKREREKASSDHVSETGHYHHA